MSLFHERVAGDVHPPPCLRLVQQADRFLCDPVVQTRLDNLESRQIGDTFQLGVAWVSLHELDEQDALSGSDGSEAETQRRGRLPLAVACVYHHQTMLFHCCLHCRDIVYSIVLPSFPRMRDPLSSVCRSRAGGNPCIVRSTPLFLSLLLTQGCQYHG